MAHLWDGMGLVGMGWDGIEDDGRQCWNAGVLVGMVLVAIVGKTNVQVQDFIRAL